MRYFKILIASVTALAALLGCRVPSEPPPGGPPPLDPGNAEYTVSFEIMALDIHGLPITRNVSVTEEVWQANGDYAIRVVTIDDVHPVSGRLPDWPDPPRPEGWMLGDKVKQPAHYVRPTTWVRNIGMGPNVIKATLTVVYLGAGGESIQCRRLDAGGDIPGSRFSSTVSSGPIAGMGTALVSCTHVY